VKKKVPKESSESTKSSVDDGKKIIETQKKLSSEKPDEKEIKESKDAEKWRNEG
jgi:hypothetical protein